jgi:hypothetical protein
MRTIGRMGGRLQTAPVLSEIPSGWLPTVRQNHRILQLVAAPCHGRPYPFPCASLVRWFAGSLLQIAVSPVSFPVCERDFPVPCVGNTFKNPPLFNGFTAERRGVSTEIPCIFPAIREISPLRLVRCSLAAQPCSRAISGSLAMFARPTPKRAEFRH